jgi:predicted alpha-1,2-mannosidase
MVKLSPDTDDGPGTVEAYEWDNARIEGFSHTHLEGPGGSNNGYSQVLVTAAVGEVKPDAYASKFQHETETAKAGYYAVTLDDPGVRAEVTATRLCGVHRYTFPATKEARILIDPSHVRGEPLEARAEVVGTDTVRGYSVHTVAPIIAAGVGDFATGTTGTSKAYFHARFSRPFAAAGTWKAGKLQPGVAADQGARVGAYATFETAAGEAIEVRVGLSFVSEEQAAKNLDAECGGRTFEEVREAAAAAWDRLLSRVEVEGADEDGLTVFYTALYRNFMQPADYTEDGRFFCGSDGFGKVLEAPDWRYYTDDWCHWDTFRTTHPLVNLLEPEAPSDMVRSLVVMYEQGGWMPKCPWNATGDARNMTGNPQFSIVADAWQKGFRAFDPDVAWAALKKGSMDDSPNILEEGGCGYLGQGTPPDYVDLGFVSRECDSSQSGSLTLEHAFADACVARFAGQTGRTDDAAFFSARSGNWKNVFDPALGLAHPKNRDGSWVEPFDTLMWGGGFTEATSWQYTWHVQQDLCGLAEAMGGTAAAVAKLDEFFARGYYAADNEPDFHAPFLYDVWGEPARTQELVAELRTAHFGIGPADLPGNDDAGATSGWYALAAIGLYPIAPGVDTWYWLTTPAFDKVTIHIDPDRKPGVAFVIEAPGAAAGKRFIRSATLNGKALDAPRVSHEDVVAGGRLVLELGDEASEWGRGTGCL